VDRAINGSRDIYNIEFAGTEEGYAQGGAQKDPVGPVLHRYGEPDHQPVVVIGDTFNKALFQGGDPIGKWIEVDGHSLQVVGVIGNAVGFPGQEDRRVLLPFLTMHKMFPTADQIMFVIVAQKGMVDHAWMRRRRRSGNCEKRRRTSPMISGCPREARWLEDFHRITATIAVVMVALSSIGPAGGRHRGE